MAAAHTVSAPISGTSASSPLTALPLCRARRVAWRRLTHSWASIRVIADIGQLAHWVSQWVAHRLACLALVAGSVARAAATLRYQSPTLMSPSRGSRKSPRPIAASCSVAHCFTTDLNLSVLVWRLPSRRGRWPARVRRGARGNKASATVLAEVYIRREIRQLHAAPAHLCSGLAQRFPDKFAPLFHANHQVARSAASTLIRFFTNGVGNRPERLASLGFLRIQLA